MIIVGYVVAFLLVFSGLIVAVDAYLCQIQGKANGTLRAADINLASTGDIDLTLRVSTNVWFQSRLHEVTMDAVDCAIYIDTPKGRRLTLSDASMMSQSESIVLKPKPLWSALDRSDFTGHDRPEYSVEGTVALARVNFAALGELLLEALVEPWTGTHRLGADCLIDAKVALFSIPSWSIPAKQYKISARREFNMTHPIATNATRSSDSSDRGEATNELQRRALDGVSEVASRLKDFLGSIPSIGPSLAKVSSSDLEFLVNAIEQNPLILLYGLIYPFSGINLNSATSLSPNPTSAAQFGFGYTVTIPQDYIPDFLVNVQVPSLTLRMTSGTPGSAYSWTMSSKKFLLDLSKPTNINMNVTCGNGGKACTLMTPVYGFAYNIMNNRRDTWVFDMLGVDNFVYRGVGPHNKIAYSLDLDYHLPSANVVDDLRVCVNVTVSDRWRLNNACVKKPPGRSEVDMSFDIPSADGTPGTYLGMNGAFTWTYSTFRPPTRSPTVTPSVTPSKAPTTPPTLFPTPIAGSPTFAPVSVAPTISMAPSPTDTRSPTIAPSTLMPTKLIIPRTWKIIAEQDVRGLSMGTVLNEDFIAAFLDTLENLKNSPTFPIPSTVVFEIVSVTYGLSCQYGCDWDYVTRVVYTASVYGGENILPLVGDNLAALVYNNEFQTLLWQQGYTSARTNMIRLQLDNRVPGKPSSQPSSRPSTRPSRQPTNQPSRQPSSQPTNQPSRQPSSTPSFQPSSTGVPSFTPSFQPSSTGDSVAPSSPPTEEPSPAPSQLPSLVPSVAPSKPPTDSNGCVYIGMTKYLPAGTSWSTTYFDIPPLADPDVDVWYNVTVKVTSGYSIFGGQDAFESDHCYKNGWNNNQPESSCSDLVLSSTGVKFYWHFWDAQATFTASVCLVQPQWQPTMTPTAVPAAGKNDTDH